MLTKAEKIKNIELMLEWYKADKGFDVEKCHEGEWSLVFDSMLIGSYIYRRKPQPKTRLLNQDDIILGKSVIKNNKFKYQRLILEKHDDYVTCGNSVCITYESLQENFTINHNNGIDEFLPCEVVE
jgi:hypothetical protein